MGADCLFTICHKNTLDLNNTIRVATGYYIGCCGTINEYLIAKKYLSKFGFTFSENVNNLYLSDIIAYNFEILSVFNLLCKI